MDHYHHSPSDSPFVTPAQNNDIALDLHDDNQVDAYGNYFGLGLAGPNGMRTESASTDLN